MHSESPDAPLEQGAKQKSSYPEPSHVSTATQNIGNHEGTLHLPDRDVTLNIPEGALPPGDPVKISLQVDTNKQHPPLQEDQITLGHIITCKPDGLKFLKPVTLSIPHSGINITEHCLQVWCKSKQNDEDAVWRKIYDGSQNYADHGVRVLVERNRINLRVDHFTLYKFVTVPVSMLKDWLSPPKQDLEIFAYLDPADASVCRNVCLRVYAIEKHDAASKKLMEDCELQNGESGSCCLPSRFVLKANGKHILIVVKNVHPQGKWVPVDSGEGTIAFTDIQADGFPARCDIRFHSGEDEDRAETFDASFDVKQEGNDYSTNNIYISDRIARRNRNRARNVVQELPQRQQEQQGQPDEAQQGQPDEAQQGQPDEAQQGQPDEAQQGQPDEAQQGQPDEAQQGQPDEAQQGQPDEAQQGQPDEAQQGQPDEEQQIQMYQAQQQEDVEARAPLLAQAEGYQRPVARVRPEVDEYADLR